jgi:hypothetical protein
MASKRVCLSRGDLDPVVLADTSTVNGVEGRSFAHENVMKCVTTSSTSRILRAPLALQCLVLSFCTMLDRAATVRTCRLLHDTGNLPAASPRHVDIRHTMLSRASQLTWLKPTSVSFCDVPHDAIPEIVAYITQTHTVQRIEVEWHARPMPARIHARIPRPTVGTVVLYPTDTLLTALTECRSLHTRLEHLKIRSRDRVAILNIRLCTMRLLRVFEHLASLEMLGFVPANDDFTCVPLSAAIPCLPPTLRRLSERFGMRYHGHVLGVPDDDHLSLTAALADRFGSRLVELELAAAFNYAALRLLATALPQLTTLAVGRIIDVIPTDRVNNWINDCGQEPVRMPITSSEPWFPFLVSFATHACDHKKLLAERRAADQRLHDFLVAEMQYLTDLALGPTCCSDLSVLSRLGALRNLSLERCDRDDRNVAANRERTHVNVQTIIASIAANITALTHLHLTGNLLISKNCTRAPIVDLRPLSALPYLRYLGLVNVPTSLSLLSTHVLLGDFSYTLQQPRGYEWDDTGMSSVDADREVADVVTHTPLLCDADAFAIRNLYPQLRSCGPILQFV